MSDKIQSSFQRYEKKYRLTAEQERALLRGMTPYMKEDVYGRYSISNIYYDTDRFHLIRASLEKPVYKEKLRVRSYGVPGNQDKVFVELKKKFDGVVYKRRITTQAQWAEPFLMNGLPIEKLPEEDQQIGREIQWFQKLYQARPQVFIAYDRLAFAGVEDPELRITFDTGLRWRADRLDLRLGDDGFPLMETGQVLMEVKIPGACPLWLSQLLGELEIFPASFSKYGTCYQRHLIRNQTKEGYFCA